MYDDKCDLFGSFGYIMQLILGVLSFMVLVIKRLKEKPMRPWKIWFFDVSKQIVSASVAHLLNLVVAIFLSVGNETDECVWYFINILIDTTFGVVLCYFFMIIIDKIAKAKGWKFLQSGLYFDFYEKNGKKKAKLKVKRYFAQLAIWVFVVIISKVILLGFQKLTSDYLERFGNTVLSPFSGSAKLKLVVVLIIIPLFLNAINFWLIDNILKFNPEESLEGNMVANVYKIEEEKEKQILSKSLKPYIHRNDVLVAAQNNKIENKKILN